MIKEKQKKVLIVEDDLVLIEMYKEKLKMEGFRVATASDGKKAIGRIREGADLILLDILMPGLNGFEVCEKIKSDPETSSIPVIILTARDMGEDVEKAMEKRADWFIAKPYDNKYLLGKISQFLEKKGQK